MGSVMGGELGSARVGFSPGKRDYCPQLLASGRRNRGGAESGALGL